MAITIILSTLPIEGHFRPALAAARKLKSLGYHPIFAMPEPLKDKFAPFDFISTNGDLFRYSPVEMDIWPGNWRPLLNTVRDNLWSVFATWTSSQIPALRTIVEKTQPSLIVSDCLHLAPLLVAQEFNKTPCASLGVTPYRRLSSGSPLLQSGLGPARNPLTRIAYDIANRTALSLTKQVWRRIDAYLASASPAACAGSALSSGVFAICEDLSSAYWQCSVPALEDQPTELVSDRFSFVGPLNTQDIELSDRLVRNWPTQSSKQARSKSIFLTWGTMQALIPQLWIDVARDLIWTSGEAIKVVVAPPDSQRAELRSLLSPEVSTGRLEVLSKSDEFVSAVQNANLFVSNGGFGGVKLALSAGVPVIAAGNQDDKADVCGRLTRSGAGVGLAWRTNSTAVCSAIRRVISNKAFYVRALEVGQELQQYNEPKILGNAVGKLIHSSARHGLSGD